MHEIATKLKAELKRAEADRAERIRKVDIQGEAQNQRNFQSNLVIRTLRTSYPGICTAICTVCELFIKRLENEKLKEENEVIKSQIENLKILQNDYNDKLDQAAENIEIAKLNLGPSREEFIALEGEVKRIRNSYHMGHPMICALTGGISQQ